MRFYTQIIMSLALVVSGTSLMAQYSYTATMGNSSSVVNRDIVWVVGQAASFNDIASPLTAGTITPWEGVTGGITNYTNPQHGQFNISGEPDQVVVFSLPEDGTVTLTSGGGGDPMPLSNFRELSSDTKDGTFLLDGTGYFEFHIKSTLNVGALQAPGSYYGEYTVVFNYQ